MSLLNRVEDRHEVILTHGLLDHFGSTQKNREFTLISYLNIKKYPFFLRLHAGLHFLDSEKSMNKDRKIIFDDTCTLGIFFVKSPWYLVKDCGLFLAGVF